MALARWQATITDDEGNILPLASVEVRAEIAGSPLAVLYTDREGATPAGNPVAADSEGFVYFHVTGGAYKITATSGSYSRVWRYVGVGTASEGDQGAIFVWRGEWDSGEIYNISDCVQYLGRSFVALQGSTNETPPVYPDTTNAYWDLIASRGEQGFYPGVEMEWDTGTTDDNPGEGAIRLNHATPASATFVYIDKQSALAEEIAAYIATWDDADNDVKGVLEIVQVDDRTASHRFEVDGALTDATTYYKVPVAHLTSGAGSLADGDRVGVLFIRSGDNNTLGFGSIEVSGQTTVTADGPDEVLTLAEGANVTITTDNTTKTVTISAAGGSGFSQPQGRLTITDGEPVNVTNTNITTMHYEPYVGDMVPIYDGSEWAMMSIGSGGLSQAGSDSTKSPAAAADGSLYDFFVWDDGGTLRCTRGPAWSSATARGTGAATTELERVNGLWMNKYAITNGPGAQRGTYVGTAKFETAGFYDSQTKRNVWNAYNRRCRALYLGITTDSWNYSTNTWRQVQGSTTYQFEVVMGMNEEPVYAMYAAGAANSTATARNVRVGWGLDSTSAPLSGAAGSLYISASVSGSRVEEQMAWFQANVGLGFHYLAALEKGAGADTQTWYGDVGGTEAQYGMLGHCFN